MKIFQRRLWIIGLLAVAVVILLTITIAPRGNVNSSGSTYGRDPSGYGAWYEYMKQRGTAIERWQKPLEKFLEHQPRTLLRINPSSASSLDNPTITDWIKQGNTLIVLGISEPVTDAEFSSFHSDNAGRIKIDTRRRKKVTPEVINLLGDKYGIIVWSKPLDRGQLIYAVTPYLAANAYQDYLGNYEFLSRLVTQTNQPIWVDEYIHGYKDSETIKEEIGDNIWSYLAKTPLLIVFLQGLFLLLLGIWYVNYRFGKPIPLPVTVQNNSKVYIEALAAVLHKASSSEFILSTITPAEQRQLQQKLGLGTILLESQTLIEAVQQAGKSTTDLETVLKLSSRKRPLNDTDLLDWLARWRKIKEQ